MKEENVNQTKEAEIKKAEKAELTKQVCKRIDDAIVNIAHDKIKVVADEMGISVASLYLYRHSTMPSLEFILKFCKNYDVSSDYLLFGTGELYGVNLSKDCTGIEYGLSEEDKAFAEENKKLKEELEKANKELDKLNAQVEILQKIIRENLQPKQ